MVPVMDSPDASAAPPKASLMAASKVAKSISPAEVISVTSSAVLPR